MEKEITVILARAGWCGHCKHFEPIYGETIKNYSNNKFLSKHKISFKDYDLATNEGKTNFTINHLDAVKMVEGYPTVLVSVNDKKNKNNKYYTIPHTIIDENIKGENKQHLEASERFLVNISNLIKSLDSDSKILYTQTGGALINNQTSVKEEMYRKKYLKYKLKYIELKK
jgi:thiol-disulfide isomerase/thioredoxin